MPPKVAFATPSSPQSARTLMVLGLLQSGPRHGYDIHRILVAHGTLYSDFKKPTLYHLLARLADQGFVAVSTEVGARGPRGERLVYAITATGRSLFQSLLKELLSTYDSNQMGFQVAAGFVAWMPATEAVRLLGKRRRLIEERRAEIIAELDHVDGPVANDHDRRRRTSRFLAADHARSLMDAELQWLDTAVRELRSPTENPRRTKSWKQVRY